MSYIFDNYEEIAIVIPHLLDIMKVWLGKFISYDIISWRESMKPSEDVDLSNPDVLG